MTPQESQSWTQDQFADAPADTGQASAYGVPGFESLPRELKSAAMEAYAQALEAGHDIPFAEQSARDAVSPSDTDDQPENNSTMRKFAKIALLLAGACAVAYFLFGGNPMEGSALSSAIDARSRAAVTLADATAKANAANAALSIAKARYEAAYKREACIIAGTCIPKK